MNEKEFNDASTEPPVGYMTAAEVTSVLWYFLDAIPRKHRRKEGLAGVLRCCVLSLQYDARLRAMAGFALDRARVQHEKDTERIAFHQRRVERLNKMVLSLRAKRV